MDSKMSVYCRKFVYLIVYLFCLCNHRKVFFGRGMKKGSLVERERQAEERKGKKHVVEKGQAKKTIGKVTKGKAISIWRLLPTMNLRIYRLGKRSLGGGGGC